MRVGPRSLEPLVVAFIIVAALLLGAALGWLLNEPEPPQGVTVYIGEETP